MHISVVGYVGPHVIKTSDLIDCDGINVFGRNNTLLHIVIAFSRVSHIIRVAYYLFSVFPESLANVSFLHVSYYSVHYYIKWYLTQPMSLSDACGNGHSPHCCILWHIYVLLIVIYLMMHLVNSLTASEFFTAVGRIPIVSYVSFTSYLIMNISSIVDMV